MSQQVEAKDSIVDSVLPTLALLGFFQFATCCCGTLALCVTSANAWVVPFTFQTCQRAVVFFMGTTLIYHLFSINVVTEENITLLNEHESVDCSDQFSIVRTGPALQQ